MATETNWTPSEDSLASARIIVPIVMRLVNPSSIVDVGCKLGEWLSIFREHGVTEMLGLDRLHRADGLMVPSSAFRAVDASRPFTIGKTCDLAICLEVAEHLPKHAAATLVAQLTTAAPVVLFSAAIPGQGGHGHVNEQPHEYWHALFAADGFETIDCVRPFVWQDADVAFWYRQNTFIYARPEAIARHPGLQAEHARRAAMDMHLVHREVLDRRRLTSRVVRHLPAPLTRALIGTRSLLRGLQRTTRKGPNVGPDHGARAS